MSSTVERQAADFTPGTPHKFAGATGSTSYLISDLGLTAGTYMCMRLDGGGTRAHIRFGSVVGVTVDYSTTDTGSPPNATAASNAPHLTATQDAGYEHVRIPAGTTHLALQCEAAAGVVRIMSATGTG